MKLLCEVIAKDGDAVTIRVVPGELPESHRAYLARELSGITVGQKLWVSGESGEPETLGIGFGDE